MPIDEFQLLVLSILGRNRDPNSYVAGGSVINAAPDTPRFSRDLDLFHTSAAAVQASFAVDSAALTGAGFALRVTVNQPGFVTAVVSKGGDSLRLDWANDSAFRFFPVQSDPLMGYRLHTVDLATNKCLALAGRSEVRDIIDAIYLHQNVISLPSMIWGACGKDPGLTPDLVLSQLRRNSRITPESLAIERLVRPVDPVVLKRSWVELLEAAEAELPRFPAEHVGAVFVDAGNTVPRTITDFAAVKPHYGSVGGAWPVVGAV